MKTQKILAVTLGLALAASTSHASITLGFSSVGGQAVFENNTFSLTPTPGSLATPQFVITYNFGGDGSSTGLSGWIDGPVGGWTIGAITISGANQTASVTGTGTLNISDGVNSLTGTLEWIDINSVGTSGNVNVSGGVNLTGISYSGLNADLLALKNQGAGDGIATLSYSFIPGKTLTQLGDGAQHITGFSGQLTAAPVPEPSTVIAGALLLLPFGVSTYRSLRKNRNA